MFFVLSSTSAPAFCNHSPTLLKYAADCPLVKLRLNSKLKGVIAVPPGFSWNVALGVQDGWYHVILHKNVTTSGLSNCQTTEIGFDNKNSENHSTSGVICTFHGGCSPEFTWSYNKLAHQFWLSLGSLTWCQAPCFLRRSLQLQEMFHC